MLLRKILHIINLIFAFLLLLSYLPAFIPADSFTKLSLLGYLYPLLLIINVCFIVFWLFVKPRYMIIPLLAILIRVDYVPRFVNISDKDYENETDIKVLSYNVGNFADKVYNYDSELIKENQDSVLDYIKSSKASIVCFQDYSCSIKDSNGFHYKMLNKLGFKHFYTFPKTNNYINGNAIYSKYRIKDGDCFLKEDENNYEFIYADIRTPKRIIRVYNIHLASYMLGDNEKTRFSQIKQGNIKYDTGSKTIIHKLLVANIKRAGQIRKIMPIIDKTEKPYIVAGDFNDTPFSYTYRQITKHLSDSFVTKGRKIGRTYNGVFPAYRIDYVLYQKENFIIHNYESPKKNFSDHYPVCVTLSLKTSSL